MLKYWIPTTKVNDYLKLWNTDHKTTEECSEGMETVPVVKQGRF